MVRTQISLRTEQAEKLREHARARAMSQSAVIREALDAQFEHAERSEGYQRLMAVAGGFRSSRSGTSTHHDEALEGAYLE